MFSKPFRVKSNSQLKGSERKKLRGEILKNFPQLTEDDLQILLPNKEVIIAMKIFTFSGSSVMVYCVQKQPIIFELEQVFYPTVYMLWQFPSLLPSFTTWPLVYPKIIGGADLMLPGVVLESDAPITITSYGSLKKGDRMSVNLTNNKAAVAVGQAAIASDDMYMAARRGKAVKIIHCIGDSLWSHGTKQTAPELGPPKGYHTRDGKDEDCALSTSSPDNIDEADENPLNPSVSIIEQPMEDLSIENPVDSDKDESEIEKEDPQAHMDYLIEYCFLKAWKGLAKKVEFPLLSSTFYKLYMIPACPTGFTLDIKKSSFKKLSKFLSTMAVAGIIQVKELTKGVESIMSVNLNHQLLQDFIDTATSDSKVADVSTTPSQNHLAITETYSVTAAVLPIMSQYGFRKGTKLSAPDIRKHLTLYVKTKNLQNDVNPSLVRLDSALLHVCKAEKDHTEVSWQHLMQTFLSSMTHNFQIGASPFQAKGKLEPIDIQVASRMGNKKVTLVYNLELYNIDLNEFARTCQHGVAASTSISTVTHRKGAQLLIQGNQVHFVGKLLQEKYEIPKKYIRGLEKAIKPKK